MKKLSAETKAAYDKAVAAIQEFATVFNANEPAPEQEELEMIAEEQRDFSRDLYNGFFSGDDTVLMTVYDMRNAEEENEES